MSKKKKNNKEFPTSFVLNDIKEYTSTDAINVVSKYLSLADGSTLSTESKYEIINLFSAHPMIIKLICSAYEEHGYNSF